jgi:predicted  nucleic acid-binding Zn-ribbon protein
VTARTRQVQAAEGKKAAAAEDVKKAKMAADQKQLQLKSSETKIRDLTAKLNACKTNREYQTLGDQIAADTMAAKVLEDEILEALERIDTLKPAVPAADVDAPDVRNTSPFLVRTYVGPLAVDPKWMIFFTPGIGGSST